MWRHRENAGTHLHVYTRHAPRRHARERAAAAKGSSQPAIGPSRTRSSRRSQLRDSVRRWWILTDRPLSLTDFAKCSHSCDCLNMQLPVRYWEDATCTYHERVCQSYWSNTYVSVNESKPTEPLDSLPDICVERHRLCLWKTPVSQKQHLSISTSACQTELA